MLTVHKPIRGAQLNRVHPLARGLVLCLLGNEGIGSHANDLSANGNDGTIINGTWTPATRGWSLNLDGTGDYIDCGSGGSLDLTTAATWVIRAKQNAYVNLAGLINKYFVGAGRRSFAIITAIDTEITLFLSDDGTGSEQDNSGLDAGFTDASWTHIVLTYDGSTIPSPTISYYKNGNLIETDATAISSLHATVDNLWLGKSFGNAYFNGEIDNILIYNRALSAADVAYLYREPFAFVKS